VNGATGLLLGIDLDGVLEVSNSFPLPPSSSVVADSEDDKLSRSSARYQASMLRSLKDIQGDDNVVGFYQSCSFGNYISQSLVEMQTAHRGKLRHGGVVIVHGKVDYVICAH
jgi:translation initiation factor 3 subunit H